MTALERLLNTGYHLDVFQWNNGVEKGIGVCLQDTEIKDGMFLVGEYGRGQTFEEACEDYIRQISGKTIVLHAYTNSRKEVIFI